MVPCRCIAMTTQTLRPSREPVLVLRRVLVSGPIAALAAASPHHKVPEFWEAHVRHARRVHKHVIAKLLATMIVCSQLVYNPFISGSINELTTALLLTSKLWLRVQQTPIWRSAVKVLWVVLVVLVVWVVQVGSRLPGRPVWGTGRPDGPQSASPRRAGPPPHTGRCRSGLGGGRRGRGGSGRPPPGEPQRWRSGRRRPRTAGRRGGMWKSKEYYSPAV